MAGITLGPLTAFIGNFFVASIGIYLSFALGSINPGITIVKTLGLFGLFLVIITQTRVNVLNGYFGSLAFQISSLEFFAWRRDGNGG